MASRLFVTEYDQSAVAQGWPVLIAQEIGHDQAVVDFSGGAAQSAAFKTGTMMVRLVADSQCSILFGTNPTATTANKLLPALVPEYFAVEAGQNLKVSAVSN